jgi:hypothetical protein
MTDHEPDPTTWDCRDCAGPWPCGPARREMLATMTPTELAINQWMILEQAVLALQPMTHREAWDRFLGWSRDPFR